MEEVQKHVIPIQNSLAQINRWKTSLWSNGSGGPPGYLEMARKEDDERYQRLFVEQQSQSGSMDILKDFVLTFNIRQKESENRKAAWEKKVQFWVPIGKWVGGGIGLALLSFLAWAYHAASPVVKVLWEEYLRDHPITERQLKQISSDANSSYAGGKNSESNKVSHGNQE